ncbi:MAG: FHA domain-containing protein, partial [Myxococcota bacterium]
IAADVAALTTPVGLEDDGDTADADEDAQAEPEPEPEPEPEAEEDWTIDEAEDVPEPAVEDEDPWEDSAEEEPALAADDSPVPAPEPPSLELQDNSGWHDDEDESEAPGALAADDDDSISGVELDADLVSAPGLEDADDLAATDDAAPAWQETASPEDVDLASPKPVAPEVPVPVPPEPTAVEESEGEPDKDFDQLLADLEDLESDVGTMADPTRSSTALGGSTEVVESSATLSLTIEGDRTVEVEKTPFVIGRTSACDLQLRSERVSRQHAIIEKVGTLGFRIVDQGSSNGVWFGSERVTERMIRDGDILRIGDRRVRATIRVSAS